MAIPRALLATPRALPATPWPSRLSHGPPGYPTSPFATRQTLASFALYTRYPTRPWVSGEPRSRTSTRRSAQHSPSTRREGTGCRRRTQAKEEACRPIRLLPAVRPHTPPRVASYDSADTLLSQPYDGAAAVPTTHATYHTDITAGAHHYSCGPNAAVPAVVNSAGRWVAAEAASARTAAAVAAAEGADDTSWHLASVAAGAEASCRRIVLAPTFEVSPGISPGVSTAKPPASRSFRPATRDASEAGPACGGGGRGCRPEACSRRASCRWCRLTQVCTIRIQGPPSEAGEGSLSNDRHPLASTPRQGA